MKYFVKTRNWNGNRFVAAALTAVANITGCDYYPEEDHDNKYWMETDSAVRAWGSWLMFMALRPLSGGWTYIICGDAEVDWNYKSIYRRAA